MNEPQNQAANERLKEILTSAFEAPNPSESLNARMEKLEHSGRLKMERKRPRTPIFRRLATMGGLSLAVLAVAAYTYLATRPGEAAIAMIPADADVVITTDLKPGEHQVAAFARISAALKREGIQDKLANTTRKAMNDLPIANEITPYLSTSMASAVFKPLEVASQKEHHVVFFAVTDVGKVRSIVAKSSEKTTDTRHELYKVATGEPTYLGFEDDYLVLTDDPALFNRVDDVKNHREKSVADLQEYRDARNALPADSNLMAFVSPEALLDEQKHAGALGINPLGGTKWLAFSIAVRDQGLVFNLRSPVDVTKSKAMRALEPSSALDWSVLKQLPAGAYGLVSYAQPGKLWNFGKGIGDEDKDVKQGVDEGAADFEKNTGLSIEKDLVPALKGDATLAVYPGISGEKSDVDALLLIDDSNSADPASAADKFREFVEKGSAGDQHPVHFTQSKRGDYTIWECDENTAGELRKSINFNNKAPLYATRGRTLLVASSPAALNKAIDASMGGKTLAEDISFSSMQTELTQGAQVAVLVNMHKVMNAILESSSGSIDEFDPDTLMNVFGGEDNGLVASGKYDGQVFTGTLFLPLDFDRAAKLMGKAMADDKPDKPEHESDKTYDGSLHTNLWPNVPTTVGIIGLAQTMLGSLNYTTAL